PPAPVCPYTPLFRSVDPGRDRDVGVRVVPAVLGRLPRDLARAGRAAPRARQPRRPGRLGRAVLHLAAGRDRPVRHHGRVPAPARAADPPGRPGADRRPVRRGGRVCPAYPTGPVHHPRTLGPVSHTAAGTGGRLRRCTRPPLTSLPKLPTSRPEPLTSLRVRAPGLR